MYELPPIKPPHIKEKFSHLFQSRTVQALVLIVIILVVASAMAGKISVMYLQNQVQSFFQRAEHNVISQISPLAPPKNSNPESYESKSDYEQAVINTVKSASPSVVSIIISKNLPVYQQQLINPFEGTPFGNEFPGLLVPQQVQNGTQKQENRSRIRFHYFR
jgi:predicted PurR-regulated permease PerM